MQIWVLAAIFLMGWGLFRILASLAGRVHPAASAPRDARSSVDADSQVRKSSAGPLVDGILMVCLGLAIAYISVKRSVPASEPLLSLPTTAKQGAEISDPCRGKERCVNVYLAPWCPACHAALAFIDEMRSFFAVDSRAGFRVIVGYAGREEVEQMAFSLKGVTYMDYEGALRRAMRFSSVPQWWVTDQNRRVLRMFGSGGASGASLREAVEWFVRNELQLKPKPRPDSQ